MDSRDPNYVSDRYQADAKLLARARMLLPSVGALVLVLFVLLSAGCQPEDSSRFRPGEVLCMKHTGERVVLLRTSGILLGHQVRFEDRSIGWVSEVELERCNA